MSVVECLWSSTSTSCCECSLFCVFFFFFQAEDGIRDLTVTGVQTCALPIYAEAVAGGDDDVLPDLDGPDLLVEVTLLTDDRPGAVLLEHPDGEVLEIRAALLLVHQRLLGAQPPAHAFGHLFEVHFLDTEAGRRLP